MPSKASAILALYAKVAYSILALTIGAMPVSVHHRRYAALQKHLKTLRVAAELTQTDLAVVLKVDQSFVSKVERGERYMDLLFYLDWCRACDADPGVAITALVSHGA